MQILSGAVVAQGELDAVVTAVGSNTFFGKTISLLGAPQERGHLIKVLRAPGALSGQQLLNVVWRSETGPVSALSASLFSERQSHSV